MLQRVQKINLEEIAGPIFDKNTEKIKQYNIAQLMQGKNNKGELLSPRHSDNPFFKSRESALRYAGWKKKLYPETPFDIPNLKITGLTHDELSFKRKGSIVMADSAVPWAPNIAKTYSDTAFGLDKNSLNLVFVEVLRAPMGRELARRIGCDWG